MHLIRALVQLKGSLNCKARSSECLTAAVNIPQDPTRPCAQAAKQTTRSKYRNRIHDRITNLMAFVCEVPLSASPLHTAKPRRAETAENCQARAGGGSCSRSSKTGDLASARASSRVAGKSLQTQGAEQDYVGNVRNTRVFKLSKSASAAELLTILARCFLDLASLKSRSHKGYLGEQWFHVVADSLCETYRCFNLGRRDRIWRSKSVSKFHE